MLRHKEIRVQRRVSRVLSVVVAALTISVGVASADPLKVGFVYVGPTGDAGWTYSHDEARKFLEAQLGDAVETSYVESVPEGADAERVIRQLASKGHELIFTTSFGYMNPTLKVAKRFPKVSFEHASGYKRSKNILDYKVGADLLINPNVESEVLQGVGKSQGFEFLVRKNEGKLNGWLGYTYARSYSTFINRWR